MLIFSDISWCCLLVGKGIRVGIFKSVIFVFIILFHHINNIAYFDCRYTVFNLISTNITFHINTHYIPSYHYIPLSLSTSFILSITLIQHYIPLSITFYLHIALKLSTIQFNTFYNLTNKYTTNYLK